LPKKKKIDVPIIDPKYPDNPFKNPFPEFIVDDSSGEKVPSQRYRDWNDGYASGFVMRLRQTPGAGDLIAGALTRGLLRYASPSTLKKLDAMGLAPGMPEKK